MVSLEYLKAARIKQQQPSTSKSNPFGDEEDILDGYPHMSMFKFLDEDSFPLPAPIGPPTKKQTPIRPPGLPSPRLGFIELHHPRPRRVPAHIEALARFEEMAQTMDCAEFVANGKGVKKPVREPVFRPLTEEEEAARRVKWAMSKATKPNWQQKRERVFFMPEELSAQPASGSTSEGLACISPSFLDHFPEHAKRQMLWGHGPRPEDLPKSSFVLTSATIRRVVPPTSPTPPLPFQSKVDNAVQEGHEAGPLDYCEDDYPNYSWSEHDSDFDDVEQLEEDNGHYFTKSFDEQSSVQECEDSEYKEYCTASDFSGYDADDDTFGDGDGSVYAPSSRASPNPFLFPCPYSSTGSLTYSSSPSLTDCQRSVYSGSSEEVSERFLRPQNGRTRKKLLTKRRGSSMPTATPCWVWRPGPGTPFAVSSLRRLDIEGPSWTTTPGRGITPGSSCRSGRLIHYEGCRLPGLLVLKYIFAV
ncbi:uncharacterized protein FOMMEDRAFT_25383 [Fomitiporia mediterranea MF3/22]|uniref:uncharacterized protein n=1 Tax=Fomitiporia mediterranea (strain MF3/22) TaxID=694068 RepID=UPI0004408CEC|nr:uncharacterized protein FOMMEDRAFT_25383 [Fomitiporia mediterranea MF3/22]EJD08245.1 hypothetical protein FOMMEDRAFT_25383 [Fomitiporia mediterranea MF3/22]